MKPLTNERNCVKQKWFKPVVGISLTDRQKTSKLFWWGDDDSSENKKKNNNNCSICAFHSIAVRVCMYQLVYSFDCFSLSRCLSFFAQSVSLSFALLRLIIVPHMWRGESTTAIALKLKHSKYTHSSSGGGGAAAVCLSLSPTPFRNQPLSLSVSIGLSHFCCLHVCLLLKNTRRKKEIFSFCVPIETTSDSNTVKIHCQQTTTLNGMHGVNKVYCCGRILISHS